MDDLGVLPLFLETPIYTSPMDPSWGWGKLQLRSFRPFILKSHWWRLKNSTCRQGCYRGLPNHFPYEGLVHPITLDRHVQLRKWGWGDWSDFGILLPNSWSHVRTDCQIAKPHDPPIKPFHPVEKKTEGRNEDDRMKGCWQLYTPEKLTWRSLENTHFQRGKYHLHSWWIFQRSPC